MGAKGAVEILFRWVQGSWGGWVGGAFPVVIMRVWLGVITAPANQIGACGIPSHACGQRHASACCTAQN